MSPRQSLSTNRRRHPRAAMAKRTVAIVGFSMLVAVGCSADIDFSFGGQGVDEAAVELIQGPDMQAALNLGEITNAQCVDPGSDEVGTTFTCTADSPQGQLEFDVEVDREDHIFANASNVISQDAQATVATNVAQALNAQTGSTLLDDSIDCGDQVRVVDAPNDDIVLDCALTDPDTGNVFDADITITDFPNGTSVINVAETPRP